MLWRKKTRNEDATRASGAREAAPSEPVDKPASTEPETKHSPVEEAAKEPKGPKYLKPNILLVDMPSQCKEVLCRAGYNVAVGSFGTPYRVKASTKLMHVSTKSVVLPNYEEQEVVLVDTEGPKAVDKVIEDAPVEGVDEVWQSCESGIIDPRPRAMRLVRKAFERIWNHGGVFVVFVSDKEKIKYIYGHADQYGGFSQRERFALSNWSFLGDLDSVDASSAYGQEIRFDPRGGDLVRLLERGAEGVHYECTLEPHCSQASSWGSLAKNKYGGDVAGVLVLDDPSRFMLVLPKMPAVHQIVVELLEKWCALWSPALFPHIEGGRWVHRPEYEIPKVIEIQRQIKEVNRQTEEAVQKLEAEVKKTREENSDWYVLLRGTGGDLVQAVIRALHKAGFRRVVDVDKESHERGADSTLREDIQVHDGSPTLVIDVKGVKGCPDDDETRQAEKHAIMRIREWKRTDVKPLTIVNHQRHLPPRDRHAQAYRQEIIDNARDTGLGLMTTWDLFTLIRNKEALGWPEAVVLPIFYRPGRIEPVPEHYHEIGKIVKVWQSALGIVPSAQIRVGARFAIQVGDTFEEIVSESLQVESQQVEAASPGSNCGIACEDASGRFREGMRVFLVVDCGA